MEKKIVCAKMPERVYKKEFIKQTLMIAEAIKDNESVTRKGQRGGKYFAGWQMFPGTEDHAKHVYKKFGTLWNCSLSYTANEMNLILKDLGVTLFKAYPTKSRRFCRLRNI